MHGSDAYKVRMDALVDELGIRNRCIFLGNRDDVHRLYPACDVTVLPSLFEGTPNVALESMACGIPVVATDVSDNAVVVPNDVAGFIVPSGDEERLATCISRLSRARAAIANGSAAAWVEREFSTTRLCEKTEGVFRDALAARRARSAPKLRSTGHQVPASSVRIVPTPCASAIVRLTGVCRLTKNVSVGSGFASPETTIETVMLVTPAAKTISPLLAV